MTTTKLTTKGQIVIPKIVRQRLRWRPGTRLQIETTPEGAVILHPLAFRETGDLEDVLATACGFLAEGDPVADLEAEHKSEIRRHGSRRP